MKKIILECVKCWNLNMNEGVETSRGYICMDCFAGLVNGVWGWKDLRMVKWPISVPTLGQT